MTGMQRAILSSLSSPGGVARGRAPQSGGVLRKSGNKRGNGDCRAVSGGY